jgi:hypothetical protein
MADGNVQYSCSAIYISNPTVSAPVAFGRYRARAWRRSDRPPRDSVPLHLEGERRMLPGRGLVERTVVAFSVRL